VACTRTLFLQFWLNQYNLEQNAKVQAAGAIHQQNDAANDHHQKSRGELAKLRDASPLLFEAVAGEDAKSLKL
jgi:hypothetical protein